MPRSKKISSHHFSYFLLTAAILSTLGLGFWKSQGHDLKGSFFSSNSLNQLKELNLENQMQIEDLSQPDGSILVNELFQANVLSPEAPESNEHRGLIVSVKGQDEQEAYLLLNPTQELSQEGLQELASLYMEAVPEFKNVEVDQDLQLFGEPAYFSLPNEPTVQLASEESDLSAGAIRVAVIDSGVDSTHEVFKNISVETGWNTFDHRSLPTDDVSHGTHIAGIIAGQDPNVNIVPYKIVNSQGGKLSNVIEAFNQAIDDDVDLINTSFGLNSTSYALKEVVEKAYDSGIIVVSAAGNSNSSKGFYPASYSHTIAVGAVDENGIKMSKSNYGTWVDVVAEGSHIYSSIPGNRYGYKTGTSQATATVTAAVARLLAEAEDRMDFEDVLEALQSLPLAVEDGDLKGLAIVK